MRDLSRLKKQKPYKRKIKVKDGSTYVFPGNTGTIEHICCDCGLTHFIEITPRRFGGGFTLVFRRGDRETKRRRQRILQSLPDQQDKGEK